MVIQSWIIHEFYYEGNSAVHNLVKEFYDDSKFSNEGFRNENEKIYVKLTKERYLRIVEQLKNEVASIHSNVSQQLHSIVSNIVKFQTDLTKEKNSLAEKLHFYNSDIKITEEKIHEKKRLLGMSKDVAVEKYVNLVELPGNTAFKDFSVIVDDSSSEYSS